MSQTTNPYLTEGSSSTNPLAPYYEDKRTKAGDEKDSSLKDLSASRSLQRQEASINHELLKKYLPELNAANGLTGLGVSESFNLDSLSRYQNTLSDIERSYQSGVSEVERAYNDRISQIDTEERNEYTTNKNSEYDTAKSQINYGLYTTAEDLESYIDTLTFLDNDQKAQLYEIGMGVIEKNEKEKLDTEKKETISDAKDRIDSGRFGDEQSLIAFINSLGYTEGSDEYDTLYNYGVDKIHSMNSVKNQEAIQTATILIESASTREEVDSILERYKPSVGDLYGELENVAESMKARLPETPKYELSPSKGAFINETEGMVSSFQKNLSNPGEAVYASTPGGSTVLLESKGEVDDSSILNSATNVENGSVFLINNDMYLKYNDHVYGLTGRGANNSTDDYSKMYKQLKWNIPKEEAPTEAPTETPTEAPKAEATGATISGLSGNTATFRTKDGSTTTVKLNKANSVSLPQANDGEVVMYNSKAYVRIGSTIYEIVF